jgi:hypothetical protein
MRVNLFAETASRSTVFDLVLLVHIGAVVASFVIMIALYAAAVSLGRGVPGRAWPGGAARFFSPGREVAGRTLYLIPLSGIVLVLVNHENYSFSTPFVVIGSALWLIVIVIAEVMIFRSAAKLRLLISHQSVVAEVTQWSRPVSLLRWGIDAVLVLLILGSIQMVVQP